MARPVPTGRTRLGLSGMRPARARLGPEAAGPQGEALRPTTLRAPQCRRDPAWS
jgi:hypothetical protein